MQPLRQERTSTKCAPCGPCKSENRKNGPLGRRIIRTIDKFIILDNEINVYNVNVADTLVSGRSVAKNDPVDWAKTKLVLLLLFVGIIFILIVIFISVALGTAITKHSSYAKFTNIQVFYPEHANSSSTIGTTVSLSLHNPVFTSTEVTELQMQLLRHAQAPYSNRTCNVASTPPQNGDFLRVADHSVDFNPPRLIAANALTPVRFHIDFEILPGEADCEVGNRIMLFPYLVLASGVNALGDVVFLPTLGSPFSVPCSVMP